MNVGTAIERTAQVTVCENTFEQQTVTDDRRHAEALVGHFHQAITQTDIGSDRRNPVTAAHDIGYPEQQAFAEAAAGVGAGEILGGKTAAFKQCDGQCVAHGERRRRARRGRKIEWAGLLTDADIQVHVSSHGQRRAGIAGHRQEPRSHAFDDGQDSHDLGRLP